MITVVIILSPLMFLLTFLSSECLGNCVDHTSEMDCTTSSHHQNLACHVMIIKYQKKVRNLVVVGFTRHLYSCRVWLWGTHN